MDVRMLFDELAPLRPEERVRRLDQLDIGETLRHSVLSLLRHGGTCWLDRPLLEQTWFARDAFWPTNSASSGSPEGASPGSTPTLAPRLGPFRLIGLLGRGSSAVVWLAEADDPPRRLALKQLVQPGMRDLRAWIARECEAQAQVNDPGIARLLDAGIEPDGSTFSDGRGCRRWSHHAAPTQLFRKSSRSAFTSSLCVAVIPCDPPL